MNVSTANELCRLDLMQFVEAGDFRKMAAAEGVIDKHLASIHSERDRNVLLHQLDGELALVDVADRPEADACLRAVKAIVRRVVGRFDDERRRLEKYSQTPAAIPKTQRAISLVASIEFIL